MSGGVLIDACGFTVAMDGSRPRSSDPDDYMQFLLPLNEYRTYLTRLVAARTPASEGLDLYQLLKGLAGVSQPGSLTLLASAHVGLPEVMFGIPVALTIPSQVEVLASVHIADKRPSLTDAATQFVAAALRVRTEVLACGEGANALTISVMGTLRIPVKILDHHCRMQRKDDDGR